MTGIQYLTGDATAPRGDGNKIICHVCNDVGGWGKGFVLALSKRWPQPEAAFRQWYAGREQNDFALGAVQFVQVEPDLRVANLVGQHGLRRAGGKPPIRYEAVETALSRVADEAAKLKASVHMPRIGCGLAGGTWDKIEPIIRRTLTHHRRTTSAVQWSESGCRRGSSKTATTPISQLGRTRSSPLSSIRARACDRPHRGR